MPGIVGIVSRSEHDAISGHMTTMTTSMVHETFYVSGHFDSTECGASFGWVAHSESAPATCPVWNASKTLGLILIGEFSAAGSEAGQGAAMRLLLDSYEKNGTRAFEQVDGRFSGVVLDRRDNTVVLFNDRFGLGRIYWHEDSDHFYFASEAKALLEVLPHCRRFNHVALGELLACGCTLENRSLFSGIELLPAASAWTFQGGACREKTTYFNADKWVTQSPLPAADYKQRLLENFPEIVRRSIQPGQPFGMSLTGGLDGRMIMASLPEDCPPIHCYTFGGPYRECADVRLARKVAQACGYRHQVIEVSDGFLNQFPGLAARTVHLSDGCMDVSGAAELYVNRVARSISTVRMTGNYGSEILRSHVAFRPSEAVSDVFSPDAAAAARTGAETYHRLRHQAGKALSFIISAQLPWHHYSRLAVEQSQVTVRSPFLDQQLVALAFQASPTCATSAEPALELIARRNPTLAALPNDRGVVYSASRLRNTVRRRFHDTLAKVEYAYDYGMPKWLAPYDRMLKPFRPERALLGFQKFCHFRIWYRDQLRDYVLDVLRDSRTRSRSYYDVKVLDTMAQSHFKCVGNFTSDLHRILTMELVERTLLAAKN